MSMLVTGSFPRTVDEKGRVNLPSRLKLALQATQGTTLYLAPGTEQCLQLHTQSSLERVAAQLQDRPTNTPVIREFARLFYARAESADVDRQGRIRIPPGLMRWANLDREITFVGVGSHMEIWSRQRWDDYLRRRELSFDDIVESAVASAPVRELEESTGPTTRGNPR